MQGKEHIQPEDDFHTLIFTYVKQANTDQTNGSKTIIIARRTTKSKHDKPKIEEREGEIDGKMAK